MADSRTHRAKLNIISSLGCQFITLICGLIVPRMLIGAFGSEMYGATTSIAQFLGYITLLEGGIGGVARAALYKPLAENDIQKISQVVSEIKRFFRKIAYIFIAYVIVLACSFKYISKMYDMGWWFTFGLVIVISLSTFAQYFIGASYSALLQASQKTYITSVISTLTTILNTILIVLLISLNCNLLLVKFVSALVFILKPIFMWLYVRKTVGLERIIITNSKVLRDKWTGMGQHIAYYLHSHTDVVVLTIFTNLTWVAIYSVYSMVVKHIENLVSSFTSGMEALFGDMIAKNEKKELSKTFNFYETFISLLSTVLLSITAVMIIPFVKIYTSGITDANYSQPLLAFLLVVISLLFCLRKPYYSMIIAAGHFKETKMAAYGEAIINISLSIFLVHFYGIIGVTVATVIATLFRFIYYVFYLKKYILKRKLQKFFKRLIVNFGGFFGVFGIGNLILKWIHIDNYLEWFIGAIVISVLAISFIGGLNLVFYKREFVLILSRIKFKLKTRRLKQ